jgi:hypothetical protein
LMPPPKPEELPSGLLKALKSSPGDATSLIPVLKLLAFG